MLSLGTIVWLVFTVLILIGTAVIAVIALRSDESGGYVLAGVILLLWVAGSAFGMYPYSAEYHSYKPVSGVVEKIDSRIVAKSNGQETKFVVKFASNSQLYGCNDTRCANTKVGDKLSLTCIRDWQFAGVDGYTCKYNQ